MLIPVKDSPTIREKLKGSWAQASLAFIVPSLMSHAMSDPRSERPSQPVVSFRKRGHRRLGSGLTTAPTIHHPYRLLVRNHRI